MKNRRDAVSIFEGQEAGENSSGLPVSFCGPMAQPGKQFFEGRIVFMGDNHVFAKAFDPAFGT